MSQVRSDIPDPRSPVVSVPEAATPEVAAPVEAAPASPPAPVYVAGMRSGGLTALAVLNFVFSGFGIIGGLWRLLVGATIETSHRVDKWWDNVRGGSEAFEGGANRFVTQTDTTSSSFYILGIMGLILAVFLIVAGVGYIRQSRKRRIYFR